MADVQIHPLGVEAAPTDYTLPPAQGFVPKVVFANFDGTSAAGSFIPTLRIVSNAGTVIAEIPQDAEVAAGSSVDATWAPFLRTTPQAASLSIPTGGYQGGADTVDVPSGTVVDLTEHIGSGYADVGYFDTVAGNIVGLVNATYTVFARAQWASSFSGDRYMTVRITDAFGPGPLELPVTFRESVSPDGDVMWVAAAFLTGPLGNVYPTFYWDVYQASGVSQTLELYSYQIQALLT